MAPAYGYHVGLTGSLLYGSDGPKKDADILLYTSHQLHPDWTGLFRAMQAAGIYMLDTFGFVTKAEWCGKPFDILCPDQHGQYPSNTFGIV